MSWEHTRFRAVCDGCGHEGVCISSSDDWGRTGTAWEGFDGKPPSDYAVARKRVGARDMQPVCPECGSTSITRKEAIR